MPLEQSSSQEAFKHNVEKEVEAGKPQKQAVAIAYETQRANDYEPQAVSLLPEALTASQLNDANKKYWRNAGGQG